MPKVVMTQLHKSTCLPVIQVCWIRTWKADTHLVVMWTHNLANSDLNSPVTERAARRCPEEGNRLNRAAVPKSGHGVLTNCPGES